MTMDPLVRRVLQALRDDTWKRERPRPVGAPDSAQLTVSTPLDAGPNYIVICTCGQPCPMHGPAVAADPPGECEPKLLEAGRHLDADALPDDLAALRGRFYVSSDRTADAFDAALAEIVRLRATLDAAAPENGLR